MIPAEDLANLSRNPANTVFTGPRETHLTECDKPVKAYFDKQVRLRGKDTWSRTSPQC